MEGACRTCMGKETPLLSLFSDEGELHHMTTCCTGLVIHEDDGLPRGICRSCSTEVLRCYSFRTRAISSDAQLRKVVSAHPAAADSDGDESVVLFVNTDDSSVSNDCSSFFKGQPKDVIPSETKSTNESESTRRSPRTNIKRYPVIRNAKLKRKKLDQSRNNLRIVAIKKHLLTKSSNFETELPNLDHSDRKIGNENHARNANSSEGDRLNLDEDIIKLKQKVPRKPGSVAYGCRKCDQHFLSWSELARHNSQHSPTSTSLRLCCRHCGKAFMHQRHVNPHIRREHSTLARFQCGYCEKRWNNVRDLKMHISQHLHFTETSFCFKDNSIEPQQESPDNIIKLDLPTENLIQDNGIYAQDTGKVKDCAGDKNHTSSNVPVDIRNKVADSLICYACRQLFIDLESLQAHLIEAHMMEEETNKSSLMAGEHNSFQMKNEGYTLDITTNLQCLDCSEVLDSESSLVNHRLKEHSQVVDANHLPNIDSPSNLIFQYEEPTVDDNIKKNQDDIMNQVVIEVTEENNKEIESEKNEFDLEKSTQDMFTVESKSDESKTRDLFTDLNEKSNETKTHLKAKLSCDICGKCFHTPSALQRHKTSHDPDKPHHCRYGRCKWSFASEHELAVHININHSGGTHECSFCRKRFPQARNLRQHMRQHTPDKRFHCQHCNKGFNHLHHLQNHERVHTQDLPFLCQECGRAFATRDRLTFHMRRHSDVRPFSCNDCGKRFISMTDLKAHMKTHSGERPHMCSTCGKTFSARHSLNKHVRSQHASIGNAGGALGGCGLCGAQPSSLQALDQHMKTHTCQYFCPLCQKGFPLTSALEAHIRTHSMGDRSHVCSECGAAFNRAEHLRGHVARRHSSARPLTCALCPAAFPRAPDLAAHQRTHSGEKPYVCTECGRGFTQSGGLRVHSRLHSGERPYICGACHRAHRSAGALAAHMRTHCTPHVANATDQKHESDQTPSEVSSIVNADDLQEKDPESILTILEIQPSPSVDLHVMQNMQTEITEQDVIARVSMEKSSVELQHLVTSDNLIQIIQNVNEEGMVYEREEDRHFDIHQGIE